MTHYNSIKQIESMQAYASYESYAYHISMLRQFVSLSRAKNDNDQNTLDTSQSSEKSIGKISSVHGGNVWNTFKSSRRISVNRGGRLSRDHDDSARGGDLSVKSQPGGGIRRINTAAGALSSLG